MILIPARVYDMDLLDLSQRSAAASMISHEPTLSND